MWHQLEALWDLISRQAEVHMLGRVLELACFMQRRWWRQSRTVPLLPLHGALSRRQWYYRRQHGVRVVRHERRDAVLGHSVGDAGQSLSVSPGVPFEQ
jgi:hypothetical protein